MIYGWPPFRSGFDKELSKERFTDPLLFWLAKYRIIRDFKREFWHVTLSMITSSFGSFAVDFYYFISFREFKDYRAFFRQILPVIGKSAGSFYILIEYSDFIFVESERDPPTF